MKVSVVIPTYNGAHKVLNLLRALEKQTFQDFEIIIVIDGSTDSTKEILEKYKTNLHIQIVFRQNGGRSVARNTGAKVAKGDILLFFDDDMRPMPDCVEQHLVHHQQYKKSICVGSALDDTEAISTDFQRFRLYLNNQWNKNLPPYPVPMNNSNLLLAAANCSIPCRVFRQLGGFDERLTDAEDFELGTRALLENIPVYFKFQAKAYHDDLVSCYTYIRRQREYAKSHKNLQNLRPDIIGKFSNAQVYNPTPLKKAIFSLFANKFFVYTIDKYNWYQYILPQKVRYKLYDVVIWGLAKVFPHRHI